MVFLNLIPKSKANKWAFIKLKSFCTAKETISKKKRQCIEWERLSTNHLSDKWLMSKKQNKTKPHITQ